MVKRLAVITVLILNFNIAKAQDTGGYGSDLSYNPADTSVSVTNLTDALVEAYNNNPEIKRARAETESADELRSQALSYFLPNVSATADYGAQRTQLDQLKANGEVNSRALQAEQPLFRKGNFSRLDQGEYQAAASRYRLQNAEAEVLLAAISAYMNLITDSALLELAHNQEDVLYRQYEETGKRFKAGELTKTDVSQSISRVSVATADVSTNEANFEASRANFEKVIGRVPGSLAFPDSLPAIPATIDEALATAKENNPNVLSARYSEKAANELVDVNEGSIWPQVSLRGRMARDDNYNITGGGEYENDQVTVNLTVPLYQSGSEYSRVRQSKADASARRYDYFNEMNRAEELTKASWKRVYTTAKAIEATEISQRAAQIALDGVKKEEQLGSRTIIDVLDAEQELFDAKTKHLIARRDQIIAYYTLLARIGKLTAKDLNLPVTYHDPQQHYDEVKNKFIGF